MVSVEHVFRALSGILLFGDSDSCIDLQFGLCDILIYLPQQLPLGKLRS